MMRCLECDKNREEIFDILMSVGTYWCDMCMADYAKDRSGYAWILDQELMLKDMFKNSKTNGRIFILKAIKIDMDCESGRLCFLLDKETGRPLKYMLDCNWLKSI